MKRLAVVILFSATGAIFAAPAGTALQNEHIKTELARTVPACDTVAANAARLILQKPESQDSVVSEWKSLCDHSIFYRLYNISSRLERINADSPELDSALWTMLKRQGKYKKKARPEAELGELLKRNAQAAKPESDDGKLLQEWFLGGERALRAALPRYPKSRLHQFYRAELDASQNGLFLSMAFNAGAWFPTGSLATLGNHPSIGFNMFLGKNRFSGGLIFDFRFGNAPSNYTFYNPNTGALESTNTFFGLFIGPDFRWEFFRTEQFSLFAAAGLGYDLITHYAASRYSRERAAYSESFNLNGGLVMRAYFSEERAAYLDIELRAHRSSYNDGGKGGDTFSGAYFTAVLAAGYRLSFEDY